MISATKTTAYDRMLNLVSDCFTPELATKFAELKADAEAQARIDYLTENNSLGKLTAEELEEYESLVDIASLIAVLKSRARRYLKHLDQK